MAHVRGFWGFMPTLAFAILIGDAAAQDPPTPDDQALAEVRASVDAFASEVNAAAASEPPTNTLDDARAFLKAARWAIEVDGLRAPEDLKRVGRAVALGRGRLAEQGAPGASEPAKGSRAIGFVSEVDGSVQPAAVSIPESYDGKTPARLDVILHGRSARPDEVAFLLRHEGKPHPEGEPGILLHVFGRGNVAYRWAGETDVFEAIRAVEQRYRIDRDRIVLRGFSMGGAGAWHLGLRHPEMWCCVEAGAGFTETERYAKLGDIPVHQEPLLHYYDAVDYALNAFNVPIAGYGGEDDPQLAASTNVVEALETLGLPMETEGLVTKSPPIDFLRVVGEDAGHEVNPKSAEILKSFRDEHSGPDSGAGKPPARVRFVTYTLAANRAPWIRVEGLEEHYRRAEIEAESDGQAVLISKAENISILAVDRHRGETIAIEGREFPLRLAAEGLLPDVIFRRTEAGWELLDHEQSRALQINLKGRKRPGLQGPIDHAFTGSFLCVRGTGRPQHPDVQAWADARLDRFAADWRRFLRGEVRIKDDVDVTGEDIENYHLILFGDPGSNRLIARVLPDLPIRWTETEVAIGDGEAYSAAEHAPALIAASPLDPLRYVVLNSGHTFGADAFEGTNALLYPRLGDYAVLRIGPDDRPVDVRESGVLGEDWKPKPGAISDVTRPDR